MVWIARVENNVAARVGLDALTQTIDCACAGGAIREAAVSRSGIATRGGDGGGRCGRSTAPARAGRRGAAT